MSVVSEEEDSWKNERLRGPGLEGSLNEPGESWLFDWATFTPTMSKKDEKFEFAAIECWKFEPDDDSEDEEKKKKKKKKKRKGPVVKDEFEICQSDDLDSWLERPDPTHNGKRPSAGFKIAVMPCDNSRIPPVTKARNDAINAALGIPNFHHHPASRDNGSCGLFLQGDGSWVFVRRRAADFSSISSVIHYDPETNITRGAFHVNSRNIRLRYFEKMAAQFVACSHPLLLPLLALELTLEVKICHIDDCLDALLDIEDGTGYGLDVSQAEESRPSNYRVLVKKLGQGHSRIHLALATVGTVRLATEFIRTKISYMNDALSPQHRERFRVASCMLDQRAEYMLSTIDHAILCNGLKDRMDAQHSTLFNLITQNDSLLNVSVAQDSREIAAASKRDSSSMKIIAVLTTFFLPGTFVATFFAMPLFDWSKPSIDNVTNRHFWIFWAVAGPLTLVVMAAVFLWALWSSRQGQILDLLARASVNQTLGDEKEYRDSTDSAEKGGS